MKHLCKTTIFSLISEWCIPHREGIILEIIDIKFSFQYKIKVN